MLDVIIVGCCWFGEICWWVVVHVFYGEFGLCEVFCWHMLNFFVVSRCWLGETLV